jgi:hypothetical protein
MAAVSRRLVGMTCMLDGTFVTKYVTQMPW